MKIEFEGTQKTLQVVSFSSEKEPGTNIVIMLKAYKQEAGMVYGVETFGIDRYEAKEPCWFVSENVERAMVIFNLIKTNYKKIMKLEEGRECK